MKTEAKDVLRIAKLDQLQTHRKNISAARQAINDAQKHLLDAVNSLYPLEWPYQWASCGAIEIENTEEEWSFTAIDGVIESSDDMPVPLEVADALVKRWRDEH